MMSPSLQAKTAYGVTVGAVPKGSVHTGVTVVAAPSRKEPHVLGVRVSSPRTSVQHFFNDRSDKPLHISLL